MWLRSIRPLWLREKLFWRLLHRREMAESVFQDVPLEFCPAARMDVSSGCVSHRQIAMLGYLDREFSKIILRIARERGGLMVDVGANWGYFTCLWAAASPTTRAAAYEPSPRNFPGLLHNIRRNNLAGRVTAKAMAAGHEVGALRFDLGPEGETGWGGLSQTESPGQITVPVTTLDEEFGKSAEEIEVLKIDTEGADYWVIEGAASLLGRRRIKHIFFEANPGRMQSLGVSESKALDLLRDCGYNVEGSPEEWHAYLKPGGAPKAA